MTRAARDRVLKDVNGDISDHLHNHIHLTNCIHLKNHMHKHSPILADRAVMKDLVALQRSRSLKDPSASPHSWRSPSVVDMFLKRRGKNEVVNGRRSVHSERSKDYGNVSESSPIGSRVQDGVNDAIHESRRVKREESSRRFVAHDVNDLAHHVVDSALSCNHDRMPAQVEKNVEENGANMGNNMNWEKRCKFQGARRVHPSIATQEDHKKYHVEERVQGYDRQNVTNVPRNGCGIPWNWSSIHHRGKSFLSCGLSESRLKEEGSFSRRRKSDIPVMSENLSSSTKSDGEAFPLLLDASGSQKSMDRDGWVHDYSGELGIFADNMLKHDISSSECGSYEQNRFRRQHTYRHQSLTQKYMPRKFRDIVGQSLVVQALSNAITRKKIGSLYVFYGPHGTGKTTCARIFARALTCQSMENPKPCGHCDSCVAHETGRIINVKEISPVSNIDFESIIELFDDTVASQHQSQRRVFIFDECDTFSSDCWSAILKIIDRAPRRVVFVLVCSRLDVLPHVIISRCQKFVFSKLKDAEIIYTLQWIATKEDLEIDKDALKLIASRSDGSLRDAEMTLEQLSLLGQRISLCLVQELVGLISDEKLVDLLDLALSADTVNTVKNVRDIMESGVDPLALMSQLATVITDILAGSYDIMKERPRRKFFHRQALSREDMEKLRQALKTLSEAEKQLRVSSDKMTWLTAALLQLAPDQQYMLTNSSTDTTPIHSPLVLNNEKPRKSNGEMHSQQVENDANDRGQMYNVQLPAGRFSQGIEEIWLEVLENIPINSLKEFMYHEGKLISLSYGAAPTVQLLFNSQLTKSEVEKYRSHILQAFESVLRSPVTIEIRCELRDDIEAEPILFLMSNKTLLTNQDEIQRPRSKETSSGRASKSEIVEVEASPDRRKLGDRNQSLDLVKSKIMLANVIHHGEGCSQHRGWSSRKADSIVEKLEKENLKLEPRSRGLLCWNPPKITRPKLSRMKIRTRKSQAFLKFVSCGKCYAGKSPR